MNVGTISAETPETSASNPAAELVQSATALVERTSSVLSLCRTAVEMTRRRARLHMMLAAAVGCVIGIGLMLFVVVLPLHRDIAEWRAVAEKWHTLPSRIRRRTRHPHIKLQCPCYMTTGVRPIDDKGSV